MKTGFIFDLNKCVGCEACAIACRIENDAIQSESWRTVTTFNAYHHPALPLFHFSLACQHCEDPLCLVSCPTRAYTRDELTLTVDHHPDRCIGCRYCTWACPYDAPKFVETKGVVEKCTLCKARIIEGKKPNCANLCPTGALDFGEAFPDEAESSNILDDRGMRPRIKIIPLRTKAPRQLPKPSLTREETFLFAKTIGRRRKQTTLKEEWPLVIFTLVAALVVGSIASTLIRPISINPVLFLLACASGLALSAIHLGKRRRAWRAVLNIRNSWLSREILAFAGFVCSAAVYLTILPDQIMAIAASLFGLMALMSIDMVYTIAESRPRPALNSGSVLLTAGLVLAVVSQLYWLFVAVSSLKFILYALEVVRSKESNRLRYVSSAIRILSGFFLPALLWQGENVPLAAWLLILLAEAVNRMEFYADLDFPSPMTELQNETRRSTGL